METLKEALELRKIRPDDVRIIREVRYYANVCGTSYILAPDWTQEDLENKLHKLEKEQIVPPLDIEE